MTITERYNTLTNYLNNQTEEEWEKLVELCSDNKSCLHTITPEVHVLIIQHKHGEDISVHSSEEYARNELYDYICNWWGEWDELPWDEDKECNKLPENRDEAIDMYFEVAIDHGEGYEIAERTLDGE